MSLMTAVLSDFHEIDSTPIVLPPRRDRTLRLHIISDLESMIAAQGSWNSLAGDHPFLRWEWIVTWWKNFHADRAAKVLVVLDADGHWVGLFPLYIYKHRFWGRVLANMGNGRTCSDHVRPIVNPDHVSEVIGLMSEWISAQASEGKVDVVDWDGVDQGDPLIEALEERLAGSGMAIRKAEIEGAWIARLTNDWTEFERITKKCFRRKLNKARRNMSEQGVRVSIFVDPADIRRHWESFAQLHEARQRQKQLSGCFDEAGFSDFLKQAAVKLAAGGNAALILAEHDGSPIGAVLIFQAGNRAYLYQSGFDPAKRALEPGHMLVMTALQHCIERGITHFDFLRGDEPYKARWNATRNPMNRVRIFSSRWQAWLRMALWDWRQRRRLRRVQTAPTVGLAEVDSAADDT